MRIILFILFVGILVGMAFLLFHEEAVAPDTQQKEVSREAISEANIRVFEPTEGALAGLPLVLKGEARVFEGTVQYRLLDEKDNVLVEDFTVAMGAEAGAFSQFKEEIYFGKPSGERGTLKIFTYSAEDGTEIDAVSIPVRFDPEIDDMTVKVFFGNRLKDPGAEDCTAVYPVVRRIPKTQGVARAALEQLLSGATMLEQKNGAFTSINDGAAVQKIVIRGGTAYADFDDTLERAVGGSCRVAAIRAQIRETLKQFSGVNDVIISINGRTEDILQP